MAARAETVPAWQRGRVASWIVTTDHKRIGILYIGTSLVFLVLAGLMALAMRLQLMQANADVIGPERYNELVTIHGTAMVFLVGVPILAGFANYLVPLMIGTHDMAFPRLNALSYWLFLFGGLVLMLSFFAPGGAAQAGWTIYPPLSEQQPGDGVDLWILSIHILTVASIAGAINFIVTIQNMRTRGMTWTRMPLFVWSIYVFAWLLIAVLPVLSAALTMLLLDRGLSIGGLEVHTSFFDPSDGGSAVLYQHAFWFFGHPEVYVIVLPAFGIISEVLPVFARKPIFGYKAVAFSTVAIGFFSMLVWAHHMFTVGLSVPLQSFFMVASMVIAVPTGMKIFNWLATLWRGNLAFDSPMLYALGFLSLFVMGGLTGIYLAAFPVDWQVHDTYFVVAHFHYTLLGGVVFAIFAGLFYWWPKMFGRKLGETLGKWQFWTLFVGFNLTFFPQHFLGLEGMPRRIYTYANEDWETWNVVSTIGSWVMGVAILLFLVNVIRSRKAPRVGNDPWQADTLEWYTTSPPPPHNFDEVPYVTSARPLWDLRRKLKRSVVSVRSDLAPGVVFRALALGGTVATGLVVTSAVLELGTTHWGLALVALPLLAATAIVARYAYPQLLRRALVSLGLLVFAIALGGIVAWSGDAAWANVLHVGAAAAALGASLVLVADAVRGSAPPLGAWRDYATLTKPRIMTLLLLTGAAGMFVGAQGVPPLDLLVITMLGLALACGGASALNHVLDRDIDRLMGERTRNRPVASGRVSPEQALEFGLALSALSFALLASRVNLLTAALALAGNAFYVVVYTRWLKRSTPQNIVIGGAAGAVPPLVGFAAATGNLTLPALWLFLIVFLWTPPHFWALALMIKKAYASAGVPMLPVVRGDRETARQILLYTVGLVAFTIAVGVWLGPLYTAAAAVLGAGFLVLALLLRRDGTPARAQLLFHYSLAYLALLFAAAAIDPVLV